LQLSDNQDADVSIALRCFREGDSVRAKILSVDIEKRRISFGLKPSYLADDERNEQSDTDGPASEALGVIDETEWLSENDEVNASDDENDSPVSADDDDDDGDDDESIRFEMDKQSPPNKRTNAASADSAPTPLKLQGGFQWSGTAAQSDEEMGPDSSSDEETEQSKKKKRRKKEIEQDLTADMHTKTPESNADFERLLLGSPNSSYLWIQYMSFQLQLSEVEKAREVARRALRTINFREEQEKLNVWIAMLNLENTYGTDESLETTFKDAVRHNDAKTIHLRLAFIFDQAEKHEVRRISTLVLLFNHLYLSIYTESRRTVQANEQEVRPEFEGVDTVRGTLFQERGAGTGKKAPSSQPSKSGKTQT
jgi:rRNA biogenesis protein RRP5